MPSKPVKPPMVRFEATLERLVEQFERFAKNESNFEDSVRCAEKLSLILKRHINPAPGVEVSENDKTLAARVGRILERAS